MDFQNDLGTKVGPESHQVSEKCMIAFEDSCHSGTEDHADFLGNFIPVFPSGPNSASTDVIEWTFMGTSAVI